MERRQVKSNVAVFLRAGIRVAALSMTLAQALVAPLWASDPIRLVPGSLPRNEGEVLRAVSIEVRDAGAMPSAVRANAGRFY